MNSVFCIFVFYRLEFQFCFCVCVWLPEFHKSSQFYLVSPSTSNLILKSMSDNKNIWSLFGWKYCPFLKEFNHVALFLWILWYLKQLLKYNIQTGKCTYKCTYSMLNFYKLNISMYLSPRLRTISLPTLQNPSLTLSRNDFFLLSSSHPRIITILSSEDTDEFCLIFGL